jgi:hypothetical protein
MEGKLWNELSESLFGLPDCLHLYLKAVDVLVYLQIQTKPGT